MALGFTFFLLSLAGIPPLVGFIGKFYLFSAAMETGWAWWIAAAGAVNSVISAFYYLRIIYEMFLVETDFKTAPVASQAKLSALGMVIAILAIGVLAMGLYPDPLLILSRL